MASKLQNRTQMAPWAQRNCFRRRMIVEDIRFGWICMYCIVEYSLRLVFFVVESLHVHGKIELCEMQRPSNFAEFFEYKSWESSPFVKCTQLSGRLFNPIDICKKLSHHFFCIFQLVWAEQFNSLTVYLLLSKVHFTDFLKSLSWKEWNATLCSKIAKIRGCQTLLSKNSASARHPC